LETIENAEIVGPVSVAKSRIDCKENDVEGVIRLGWLGHFIERGNGNKNLLFSRFLEKFIKNKR